MPVLRRLSLALLLACMCLRTLHAQVITYTPAYPTVDDTVTITYNAALGNGALAGVSPVFAHTGVINRFSTDAGDWEHQVSEWTSGYDSAIVMTPLGGNLHRITLTPRSFYGISSNERARALAFVFRNQGGTLAGKDSDGSDIHIPLFSSTSFSSAWVSPIERDPVIDIGQSLDLHIQSNEPALFTLFMDGTPIAQSSGLVHDYTSTFQGSSAGLHTFTYTADNGSATLTDSIRVIVQGPAAIANPPAGTRDGINYLNDSTAILQLFAPGKSYIYVIGDFNGWQMHPDYRMRPTPDGQRHWLRIDGLTPAQEYRFQYFVDHRVKVGDPYAEKVLDPFNDAGLSSTSYPGLIPYPTGLTTEMVAVLQTAKPAYNWQVPNFQKPDSRDLVVYELLVRDFVQRHDYQTLIDTLGYLERLGVNAIEIMPVNEFDGNNSWGYGPAYYFAPDKFYGSEQKLKEFVDACHQRGIAVIFDVVFNHCFGQAPHLRLFQERATGLPDWNNPYLNRWARHPLSPGYDFNHGSSHTQAFFDSVLTYWTQEYKADGFRFDLSKGFVQDSSGDIGSWSVRNQGRIDYIKRMANRYWSVNGGAYLILEHFANNDEETELANFGMMFWGKATTQYEQAAMGFESQSDFSWHISHQHRGWAFHNLMGFMESHDEERLMYKCLQFGNDVNPAHNVRDTTIALSRMGLVAAFWATVPGPKMMWQFGELGFDVSIDDPCRTCPKPIRWDDYNDFRRQYLFKTYAALIKLRRLRPNTFRSGSYDISAWGKQKQIHVNADMNVTLIGNFDVYNQDTWTGFQHTGWWYNYMSGDSLLVSDVNMTINLTPGSWRLFTDQRLPKPDLSFDPPPLAAADPDALPLLAVTAWPNPSSNGFSLRFAQPKPGPATLEVFDAQGRLQHREDLGSRPTGTHECQWAGSDLGGKPVPAGFYIYRISAGGSEAKGRLQLLR